MDVQDEQMLAKDILSTTVAAWGHNIVQKMHGMKSKKRIKAHCASPLRTGHLLLV